MTVKTPSGVGWPGMPVEMGARDEAILTVEFDLLLGDLDDDLEGTLRVRFAPGLARGTRGLAMPLAQRFGNARWPAVRIGARRVGKAEEVSGRWRGGGEPEPASQRHLDSQAVP
jgi:hypothetical protein